MSPKVFNQFTRPTDLLFPTTQKSHLSLSMNEVQKYMLSWFQCFSLFRLQGLRYVSIGFCVSVEVTGSEVCQRRILCVCMFSVHNL